MKKPSWSMLAIDALGATTSLLFLALGVWTAWPQHQADSLKDLAADIAAAKIDLSRLRASLDQQNNLETQLKAELSAAGRLPDQTPQEMQLQTLSSLAAQNHLTVIRQLPLAGREYPGLLEQRFAFEVTGALSDLARFFKVVESSPSWTDVSFLKIDHGKDDEAGQRNAFLTFSAFSMANTPQKKLDPARGG